MRVSITLVLLLALGTIACGGDSSPSTSPTTPTPSSPTPTMIAVFADPTSSLSTQDVRDVQDQIVRFDIPSNSLVWIDNRMFSGFPVLDSYFIRSDRFFQVRFGSVNGQRRAYFTEAVRGTICDVEMVGSGVVVTSTDVTVPNS